MEYRAVTLEDFEPLRRFLSEMGWQQRVSEPKTFIKLLELTDRTVVAVEDSRVVGFPRAVCDEVSTAISRWWW